MVGIYKSHHLNPPSYPVAKHSQIHSLSSEESLINTAGMLKLARTDSSAFAAGEDGIQAGRAGGEQMTILQTHLTPPHVL